MLQLKNDPELKFSQNDLDQAVKSRLARERRKMQREREKSAHSETEVLESQKNGFDQKIRRLEEKTRTLELKWTCLEQDVRIDFVEAVLTLAKLYLSKSEEMTMEHAVAAVVRAYPHFKAPEKNTKQSN